MEDEKLASNFELNVISLGKHRFQLVKGDRFTSNGATFDYNPSTQENKGKGKYYRYQGRESRISAKKYMKDVLRADNIKLIIDRPLSTSEPADSDYNVRNRWREWVVEYAYEQPKPEIEPLIIMIVELGWMSTEWTFKSGEYEVERETKEIYFLKKNNPANYRSKIMKTELNNVVTEKNGTLFYVVCELEHYDKNELALFTQVEKNQRAKIESAKALVIKEETNLDNVLKLKADNGH